MKKLQTTILGLSQNQLEFFQTHLQHLDWHWLLRVPKWPTHCRALLQHEERWPKVPLADKQIGILRWDSQDLRLHLLPRTIVPFLHGHTRQHDRMGSSPLRHTHLVSFHCQVVHRSFLKYEIRLEERYWKFLVLIALIVSDRISSTWIDETTIELRYGKIASIFAEFSPLCGLLIFTHCGHFKPTLRLN